MSAWFEGENEIDCTMERVVGFFGDLGGHYSGVVGLMPGITRADLLDQGSDSVTIETNEGLMKRTSISKRPEGDRIVVEFDEEYQAASRVAVTTHFREEFVKSDAGVTHRLVMSEVNAPGFLGFLYRRFGSSKMGNAFLAATKANLERPTG